MRASAGSKRAGPAGLAALLLLAALAPLLSPRSPDLQEDAAGARVLPPLTRAHLIRTTTGRSLVVTSLRAGPEGWEFVRSGRRQQLPAGLVKDGPETRFYLLGTDSLGRDLTARVLYGLRDSVAIASLAVAFALAVGLSVGAASGMLGRRADVLLMTGVDAVRSIPRLLLYLVCASLFPLSRTLLILVLGATTWTGLARIVRSQMLALRASDLAAAARAAGARPARTILRHLVPQMMPILSVDLALRFADTLLLESALSLLGLGAPAPAVSLGSIMASGREALSEAWWIVAWPGLLITFLLLSMRATAAGLFRNSDPPSII